MIELSADDKEDIRKLYEWADAEVAKDKAAEAEWERKKAQIPKDPYADRGGKWLHRFKMLLVIVVLIGPWVFSMQFVAAVAFWLFWLSLD